MNRIENFVALVALVTLSGCFCLPSVGPDYETPERKDVKYALPDAGAPTDALTRGGDYKPADAAADARTTITTNELANWWTRFDDPVLTDLVEGARTNNLSFQMAVWRLTQSEWELLGSMAAFLPKFGVGAAWNANRYYDHSASSGKANTYQAKQAALDGSWEIDLFGGNRRQTEMALELAVAAGWTVADAWVSLSTQIGQQYVRLRTTQERIEVARTNLVLQAETYEILKSRLDSGIGDELAVSQCAYILEQTRANIPGLLAQEEQLKNALTILAGKTPGELAETLKPLANHRDWLLAPQKVGELPLDLLRNRPDVMVAEHQLAAQTAAIGVAKAQWYPKLFITGQVGWKNTNETRLFDKASFFSTLGPSVSWPIFQGGAILANVKATEARTEQAVLNYGLAVDKAYAEVRDAYASYTQEYHRNKSLRIAVKAATDAVTISKDLYKNGLKDFNNVLDAQRSRLTLEEAYVISRGNITLDLIALYKSLGAGVPAAR